MKYAACSICSRVGRALAGEDFAAAWGAAALLTGVLAAVFLAAVFSAGTFLAAAFFTGAEVETGGVAGVVADFLAGIMRKGCG